MTSILVYDDTATALEKLAEQLDTSIAEVVEELLEYSDELEG